jgi:hypothetical protein
MIESPLPHRIEEVGSNLIRHSFRTDRYNSSYGTCNYCAHSRYIILPRAKNDLGWLHQLPRHRVTGNFFKGVKNREAHRRQTVKVTVAVNLYFPVSIHKANDQ